MSSTGADADGLRGAFSLDTAVPGAVPRGFDAFVRGWETQIGDGFPLSAFSPATTGDFRVKARAARVHDAAIADLHVTSAIRIAGTLNGAADQVRMCVVRRGAWTVGGLPDRGEHTATAGQFLLGHVGRTSHIEIAPHTTARLLFLPAATLRPLLGNRIISGPADSAEMRLLTAHANMIHATMAGLTPAGLQAARTTLIELARAVARGRLYDAEPLLAPALAQAAKDLADRRLADPGLSPTMLARELNVSVRTLQRAFAGGGEPATAYIRRRRLEEARLALTAPPGRPGVTELAAHWQFADSSHFTRAFKEHYGRTPTDYARSTRPAGQPGHDPS